MLIRDFDDFGLVEQLGSYWPFQPQHDQQDSCKKMTFKVNIYLF